MKKLLIILIAGLSFNAASAQNWNSNNKQDRYQATQTNNNRNYNDQHQSANNNGNYNNQQQSKDYAYNNSKGRTADYKRQAEYDKMNQQYDQRINGYKNDRSLSNYERQRRINQAEQERQQKAKSFGGGLLVGGVVGVLLGVLIGGH